MTQGGLIARFNRWLLYSTTWKQLKRRRIPDPDAFKAIHEANRRRGFLGFTLAVLSGEAPPAVAGEADFTLDGTASVTRFLKWLWRQVSR